MHCDEMRNSTNRFTLCVVLRVQGSNIHSSTQWHRLKYNVTSIQVGLSMTEMLIPFSISVFGNRKVMKITFSISPCTVCVRSLVSVARVIYAAVSFLPLKTEATAELSSAIPSSPIFSLMPKFLASPYVMFFVYTITVRVAYTHLLFLCVTELGSC